jgi:hypothetical protein
MDTHSASLQYLEIDARFPTESGHDCEEHPCEATDQLLAQERLTVTTAYIDFEVATPFNGSSAMQQSAPIKGTHCESDSEAHHRGKMEAGTWCMVWVSRASNVRHWFTNNSDPRTASSFSERLRSFSS